MYYTNVSTVLWEFGYTSRQWLLGRGKLLIPFFACIWLPVLINVLKLWQFGFASKQFLIELGLHQMREVVSLGRVYWLLLIVVKKMKCCEDLLVH